MRHLKRSKRPLLYKANTRVMALSAVLGLIAALGAYSIQTGLADLAATKVADSALEATRTTGFKIDEIFVEGRFNTPLEDLRTIVALERDMAILSADPDYLRTRIEALPWVSTATVERRLPNHILIRLDEHRPIAMWQQDGTFSLINRNGEVILTGGEDINVFAHLPLIVGQGAPKYAQDILALIDSEPSLARHVRAAVRVSERRWNIVMKNDTTIKLPEIDPSSAWHKLADLEETHKFLEKDLASIDLRLDDRILVKITETERISKPLSGQDT